MTLYVDDILLIKPIFETNDYMLLQEDMTNIANEIEKLHLTLNTSKCKYIVGSRKRQPLLPPGGLFINGSVIEQVENYCYVGVMVNQHICWSEHYSTPLAESEKVNWYALQKLLYLGRHINTWYCVHYMLSTTLRICCSAMGSIQEKRY